MRIRQLALPATAAALAVSLGLAAPTLASSGGLLAGGVPAAPGDKAPQSSRALAPVPSKDFAGYQSSGSGLSHVNLTTTFIVPAIKCGTRDKAVAPLVAAISTSSGTSAVGLLVRCQKGKARYFPILNINDAITKYRSSAARPGDKIVLRETWNSNRLSLSLVDKTRPAVSKTLTGPGASSFSDAFVGDARFHGLPIPDFGKVKFSNSILDGHALGFAPDLARVDMVNSMKLQIKTTRFASDNESFKTIFKHS